MPIRLLANQGKTGLREFHGPPIRKEASAHRVYPLAAVQCVIGRGYGVRRESQDGVKCRHRVEAAIEPEDILVEVGLQMLLADSVVRAKQPCFEVGEDDVDHGQVNVSHLRVATEHQRFVRVAHRWQRVIALPAIRPYDRPLRDVLFDERRQAIGVTNGQEAQPQRPAYFIRLSGLPSA